MGLSESERYSNIVEIVNQLYSLNEFKDYRYLVFNKIIKDLWYCLLADSANNSYWLCGGTYNENSISSTNIFGCAMIKAKDGEELGNKPSINEYNQYDLKLPTAISVLKWNGYSEDANVLKIFTLTEKYFYYINRYQDGFSKSFIQLTKNICELQGLCYKIISNDATFLKCWLIEKIYEKLIVYNINDAVDNCFLNVIITPVRLNNISFKWIYNLYKELQMKKMSTEKRLVISLVLSGDSFHSFQLSKLFSIIENYNKLNKNDKINPELIEKICIGNSKIKEKFDKESKEVYSGYCDLTCQRTGLND